MIRNTFTFPHPVNEYAARTVAAMVAGLCLVIVLANIPWLMFALAYGFLARVLTGPKLSPFGLLATRAIIPLVGDPQKLVAGPPKRFAQTVGLCFSAAAIVAYYGFSSAVAAYSVLSVLTVFALLESLAGFCAGCFVFGYLMRWGLVPQETCEKCQNLSFGAA